MGEGIVHSRGGASSQQAMQGLTARNATATDTLRPAGITKKKLHRQQSTHSLRQSDFLQLHPSNPGPAWRERTNGRTSSHRTETDEVTHNKIHTSKYNSSSSSERRKGRDEWGEHGSYCDDKPTTDCDPQTAAEQYTRATHFRYQYVFSTPYILFKVENSGGHSQYPAAAL